MADGVKPEKKFRSGAVTATIWKNQIKLPDGTMKDTHSVSVERSYKNKDDEWKTTNSYNVNDLADLETVASLARKHLKVKEQ